MAKSLANLFNILIPCQEDTEEAKSNVNYKSLANELKKYKIHPFKKTK